MRFNMKFSTWLESQQPPEGWTWNPSQKVWAFRKMYDYPFYDKRVERFIFASKDALKMPIKIITLIKMFTLPTAQSSSGKNYYEVSAIERLNSDFITNIRDFPAVASNGDNISEVIEYYHEQMQQYADWLWNGIRIIQRVVPLDSEKARDGIPIFIHQIENDTSKAFIDLAEYLNPGEQNVQPDWRPPESTPEDFYAF